MFELTFGTKTRHCVMVVHRMIHVEERMYVRTNLWHEDQALCDGGTQNDTRGGEDMCSN